MEVCLQKEPYLKILEEAEGTTIKKSLNDNTIFHFLKPDTVFEMEFPTLGKNCMRADCNVLDFLPIKCQYCGDFFCSKHFLPNDHDCKCYDATSRPAGKRKKQIPI